MDNSCPICHGLGGAYAPNLHAQHVGQPQEFIKCERCEGTGRAVKLWVYQVTSDRPLGVGTGLGNHVQVHLTTIEPMTRRDAPETRENGPQAGPGWMTLELKERLEYP